MGLVQALFTASAWSTEEAGFTLFFFWVVRTEFEGWLFEEGEKKMP